MDAALGDGALPSLSRPGYGSGVYSPRRTMEPCRFRVTCGSGGTTIFRTGYSRVPDRRLRIIWRLHKHRLPAFRAWHQLRRPYIRHTNGSRNLRFHNPGDGELFTRWPELFKSLFNNCNLSINVYYLDITPHVRNSRVTI
jgi:hypothetical protein